MYTKTVWLPRIYFAEATLKMGAYCMKKVYRTSGTCSAAIEIDLDEGIIKDVKFIGGCDGNLKGISKLVENMSAEDAIRRLKGITCGRRSTSCPDQLALALEAITEK